MIIRNAIQCLHCHEVIESKHRHDFKFCSCETVYIDGGTDYLRRGGYETDYIELSITTNENEDE